MRSILIVEDDCGIRETLQLTLELEGYVTITAANGQLALDCLKLKKPRLILLDLSMPIMNGFDFLKAQRADPNIGKIPVIITSAESTSARFEKVAGILKKPIQIDMLLSLVKEYCG